jgi:esterase/lipase
MAQPTIYFLPGQGSDKRIFDSLKIDASYQKVYVSYDTLVNKKSSIKQVATQLLSQIDTSKSFVLIGVSLGGMLCAEINEMSKPEKVIIISSAQNRKELPFRYRFQRYVPLYAIFPPSFLHFGAKIMQPIVEPDRNKQKETFKSMLFAKNPRYIKYSIKMIMQWDRKNNASKNYKIHGKKDNTIPYRKRNTADYVIVKGSHMMCLTRGDEISEIINKIMLK